MRRLAQLVTRTLSWQGDHLHGALGYQQLEIAINRGEPQGLHSGTRTFVHLLGQKRAPRGADDRLDGLTLAGGSFHGRQVQAGRRGLYRATIIIYHSHYPGWRTLTGALSNTMLRRISLLPATPGSAALQPSVARLLARRRSVRRLLVLALTAIAFTLQVSIAASHLHFAPDADEACALCAAFAGKLEGPSATLPTVAVATVVYAICPTPVFGPVAPAPAHLLPPTCGPPRPF